jgi:hypothetical protein
MAPEVDSALVQTGRLHMAVLLGWAAAAIGCNGEKSGSHAASPIQGCPPEAVIEDLHASAFHFQHGSVDVARSHLERAQAVVPARPDATSAKVVARLVEISRRIDTDPKWAQSEAEYIRLAFGDWSCLTESMHHRFHGKLPALP